MPTRVEGLVAGTRRGGSLWGLGAGTPRAPLLDVGVEIRVVPTEREQTEATRLEQVDRPAREEPLEAAANLRIDDLELGVGGGG